MAAFRSSVRWIRLSVAGGSALLLAQACGGRSDTRDYLFGPDGTIVEAGASSIGAQGTGANGTGGANNTGATGTGGTRTTGGSGVTTGGAVSIGGTPVTGGVGPIGGTVGVAGTGTVGGTGIGGTGIGGTGVGGIGAAGAPNGPTITCGTQQCNAETQQCCAGLGGLKCIGANAACNGASLGCTVTSDCDNNQVCCLSITGDASAASTCKPTCQNMGPGRDRQLCETAADCQRPFRFCTETVFGVSICTRNP